eukprot:798310-Prymnesium_polylepis.3
MSAALVARSHFHRNLDSRGSSEYRFERSRSLSCATILALACRNSTETVERRRGLCRRRMPSHTWPCLQKLSSLLGSSSLRRDAASLLRDTWSTYLLLLMCATAAADHLLRGAIVLPRVDARRVDEQAAPSLRGGGGSSGVE